MHLLNHLTISQGHMHAARQTWIKAADRTHDIDTFKLVWPGQIDQRESITRLKDFLLVRLIFIRSNRSKFTDMRMNTALYHLFCTE